MTLFGSSSVIVVARRGVLGQDRRRRGHRSSNPSAVRPALMALDQIRDRLAPDFRIDPVGDAGIGEDLRVVLGGAT